jgi:PAS domain S-box-containing protein
MKTSRLLEGTCQAAVTIVPCALAWLFSIENDTLHSRAIATEKGQSAAEVFLWRFVGNAPEHPSLPLDPADNPIAAAALTLKPAVNVTVQALRAATGGQALIRALNTLRLAYVHFLPLLIDEKLIGVLVLAGETPHDLNAPRARQILAATMDQAATAVDNLQLMGELAARDEKMQADQAFLKMVMDTMADALIVTNESAQIQFVNNRLLLMTGYTREEIYQQSVGLLFHPEGRDRLVEGLRRGGRGTVGFSQRLLTKDGQTIPVLMSRATAPATDLPGENTILILSDLTEQKKRENALELQGKRLRALSQAGTALNRVFTTDAVIETLVSATRDLLGYIRTTLFLAADVQRDMFYIITDESIGQHHLRQTMVRLGGSLAGRAARERRPQTASSPGAADFAVPAFSQMPGVTVATVPLVAAEHLIGVLEVVSDPEMGISRDEIEILENLAATASAAFEKARLYEETQQHVRDLSVLLEANAAVSSTLDMSSALNLVMRRLREAINAARCSIYTWNRGENRLTPLAEAADAYWPPESGPERGAANRLLALRRADEVVYIQRNDPRLPAESRAEMTRLGMNSTIVGRVQFNHTVNGMVELYTAEGGEPFGAEQATAVQQVLDEWSRQVGATGTLDWREQGRLTQLCYRLIEASWATWVILSAYGPDGKAVHAMREMGFTIFNNGEAAALDLKDFPTMASSLNEGAPVTLNFSGLANDPNEQNRMVELGAYSGLVTPLLVHGEATGLVKLMDAPPNRVFDVGQISLCQGIANVLASALENANLYQSLHRRAEALENAYNALRYAERTKDNLLQSLSHELKTPLHKIILQAGLLADEAFGAVTPEQREMLQHLLNWADSLSDMVNDIMLVQSLSTPHMTFSGVRVDILLSEAVEKARARAELAQIVLEIDVPPDLVRARADGTYLSIVFEHLIDNAIKFSPNGGYIGVRAWAADDESSVTICIEDRGIGIPEDEFARIFEKGYQVDASLTRRFSGIGMGLAISRQIIEAHGGRIWVESTVGVGSSFYVSLPTWV